MVKKFHALTATGAVLAALAFSGTPAPAQEVTLKLHTFIPPPSNPVKTFLTPWSEKVAQMSGGSLKIQLYPSMQLGGAPPQLVNQVKDGVVDMVFTLPGYTAGRFPKTEVFELPFVHTSPQATTLAIQDYQAMHLGDEWADYHVILLHCHAGSMFMMRSKEIKTVADLRGLKIRTATRAGGLFLTSLGASPLGAPLPQIPQMMSKGVIDGAMLPYEIAPAIKMQDLATYFIELEGNQPRMNTSVFSFLMNPKSYDRLSPEHKKIMTGRNIAEWAGQNWADIEIPAKKVMQSKSKNKFLTIPASEVDTMRAAAGPAIQRWIDDMNKKGYNGSRLLADARKLISKYSRLF